MKRLLTTKDLEGLQDVVWAENIRSHTDNAHVLLWHSLEELADMIELYLPLERAAEIAPKALDVLVAGREHFAELQVPRPHSVELVLLKIERIKAGLDPDGAE